MKPCWRCRVYELPHLLAGVLWGWWVIRRMYPGPRRLARRRDMWLCWYWPGYVAADKWGLVCKHRENNQ